MKSTEHGRSLTFGSLFAGIGGIDLGFERAGMKCRWQVEIDEYARRVLAKHWPEVRRHDDVRTWPQPDTEPVDIIVGGFPCQDISNAGLGAGLDGDRSGLFFEAVRVVRELRPRIVVLENVAGLLSRGLDRVLGELAEIGFDAEWHCIPAAAVGAPHIRDRVFILCHLPNPKSIRFGTGRQMGAYSVSAGQENSPTLAHANGEGLAQRQSERSDPIKEQPAIERSNWWAVEPDVGRVANGISNRVDRLRGLGNAVVPQVAEWIGREIVRSIA